MFAFQLFLMSSSDSDEIDSSGMRNPRRVGVASVVTIVVQKKVRASEKRNE